MSTYVLIPARSGSKGLPNKNILEIKGKPLIQYSIEAAIDSKVAEIDNIFLSTDSLDYYDKVKNLNISLHLRDTEISGDKSPSSDFILDFINKANLKDEDTIVLLQPTSPLRSSEDIINANNIFKQKGETVVSVCESDKSPSLLCNLNDGKITALSGIDKGYARQKFDKFYCPNGAIYITNVGKYLVDRSFFTEQTNAYIMSKRNSIDVDDSIDFIVAKTLIEQEY